MTLRVRRWPGATQWGGRRKAGGTPTAELLLGWADADVASGSRGGRGTEALLARTDRGLRSTPAEAPVERHNRPCTRTSPVGLRPALLSVTVNHPARLMSNIQRLQRLPPSVSGDEKATERTKESVTPRLTLLKQGEQFDLKGKECEQWMLRDEYTKCPGNRKEQHGDLDSELHGQPFAAYSVKRELVK
ncbi:hypothetical protein NDU88_004927 [Pleurodeles waltl]|uniref:Uncharacterized protein n=1 Tax=Pleurodeles waltl TaxID=8319 RepID=A0AAV7VII5_PLEWA|nr:hypothetical protein NDU88_004927 [Pleurodeles waltl]